MYSISTKCEQLSEGKQRVSSPQQAGGTSLKAKLIKLTLKLKDCEKKIPILKIAVQETEDFQEKEYHKKEKEFAAQLADQAKINCGKLSLLLEECDHIIEMKKRLTLESQELLQRNKIAALEMSDALKAMHSEFLSNCNAARRRWEGEKIEREKMAIERKTQEIHSMTARGLEPQLEQIKTFHQAERDKVELEAQARMDRIRFDFQREYDDKIMKARSDWEIKKHEALFEKKKQWSHRIDLLNQQNDQEIFEARKQLKQELDAQRKWQQQELQAIKESQRSEMTARRIAVTHQLQEERKKWDIEKNKMLEQTQAEIKNLELLDSENKAVWEANLKSQLNTEFQKFLEEVTSTIEKQRDATIDTIIRKHVRDRVEQDFDDNACRTKAALKESLKKARVKLEDLQRQVIAAKKSKEAFADQKLQLETTLNKQQRQLEAMRKAVGDLYTEEQDIQKKSNLVEQKMKDESQFKIDGMELQKVEIQHEIERVLLQIRENERSHREILRCKLSNHEEQLLQLEHQVKLSICSVQQISFGIQLEIDDVSAALQQTLQLIQDYQHKN